MLHDEAYLEVLLHLKVQRRSHSDDPTCRELEAGGPWQRAEEDSSTGPTVHVAGIHCEYDVSNLLDNTPTTTSLRNRTPEVNIVTDCVVRAIPQEH